MDFMTWYSQLSKPGWTPPPWAIGLIWQILYPIILVSFGFVFYQAARGRVPWRVTVPLIINLIANVLFMPIFARLHSLPLALADILVVWATIVWTMLVIWRRYPLVALAQVPYLVWVSIATVLQICITFWNR